jgi:hypothetical protein
VRRAFAAAQLLAAPAAHAQAPTSEAMIEQLIRGSYRSYIGADDSPRPDIPLTKGLRAIEAQCAAMQERVNAKEGEDAGMGACADDYDLLCQCQDMFGTDWSKVAVTLARPEPGRIDAAVVFPDRDGAPAIVWRFVRRGNAWQIADFDERALAEAGGETSYRRRLIASIAEMRSKLALAPWKAPLD